MDLKKIATISGKGGLFKVLKPARTGMILESMDDQKNRIVATMQHKISVLDEISIYTNTKEGSEPIEKVFRKIYNEFENDPGVDNKSSADELKAFLKYILPEYDESRVYVSDIKKIIRWYNILLEKFPEFFKAKEKNGPKKTKNKGGSKRNSNPE